MKISLRILVVAVLYTLVSVWLACKHSVILNNEIVKIDTTHKLDTLPPIGISCSPDSVYFQNTILPLIQANCAGAGCHDSISHVENLYLNSYYGIMKLVIAGNPRRSRLYTVLNGGGLNPIMPPQNHLDSTQIKEIYNWILEGAPNNYCDECDTTNMSYATNILGILQGECYSCHSGTNPVSGIELDSYNSFESYVKNDSVYEDINGLNGHHLMPQSGKMPQCYINQIDAWINQGAKNN
jgi:hypothetical protein